MILWLSNISTFNGTADELIVGELYKMVVLEAIVWWSSLVKCFKLRLFFSDGHLPVYFTLFITRPLSTKWHNKHGIKNHDNNQASSHYLSQCWPRSPSLYGVTRHQWVKASSIPKELSADYQFDSIREGKSIYNFSSRLILLRYLSYLCLRVYSVLIIL